MTVSHSDSRRPYLLFAATLAVIGVLFWAQKVIIPVALAVLLSFILGPLVAFFQRRGLRRAHSVLVVVTVTFCLFAAIGAVVAVQARHLGILLSDPATKANIIDKTNGLRGIGGRVGDRLVDALLAEEQAKPEVPSRESRQVIVIRPDEPFGLERITGLLSPVLEPLAMAGLVVILVIFMLLRREDLRNRLLGLLGHERLTDTTRVFEDAAHRVSRFLLTQSLINAGFGALLGIGLWLIGVPYGFLWGFLASILRFLPYIGTWVAALFPLVLSVALTPGWTQPLEVLALVACLDVLTANVAEPLLFSHSTGVSPIALLVAAAFWTWLWGPVGLVLSTPLTVCLVVIGQNISQLEFFAMLLGDAPALEPDATYYQRLLARDQEEATELLEKYARENGWDKIYDRVMLPALARTRRDRAQAALGPDDEVYVYQSTREILEDVRPLALEETDHEGNGDMRPETAGPSVETRPTVLCCPAHHEAEELSLYCLEQLLEPAGIRGEVVSTKVLASQVLARIDEERPQIVFAAVLPPGGLAQAQFLCRSIRQHHPQLPIVVGYWGNKENFDKTLVRLRSAGASYVTTSLLQSRSRILSILGKATPVETVVSG